MASFSNTLVLYCLFCFGGFVYSYSFGRSRDTKSPVTLNIQNKKSNSDYIYYELVEYRPVVVSTYSASGNTVFNEVMDGDKLVWKSSNEKDYATKVIVEGNDLLIMCPSVMLTFFKQDGTWKPKELGKASVEEKAATVIAPKETAVPFKDVASENAKLKLTVAKLEEELVSLKMEYDQFRSNVLSVDTNIVKVVEALGGVHNFVESGRTTLGHTRNTGYKDSHFADSKFTHRRHNDTNNRLKKNYDPQPKFYYSGYSDVDTSVKFNYNLISLDITKPKSTKEFEYNFNPITGADIYELKRPNLLKKVTEHERLLWESKHGKYSDKIIVFKDEKGENRLQVFIADDVSKREFRLAPPVRVPSILKATQGKKDESKEKGYESEAEKHRFLESEGEHGDTSRKHPHTRDEFIEIPKKSRDRRAALRRQEEEMRTRIKMQQEMRARLRRQEKEFRARIKRLEDWAKVDHRHKTSKRHEYRHMEDFKHPKLKHDDKPKTHGRPSTRPTHRTPPSKPEPEPPGDLFLLFASLAPNEKKFDLLVNGETERYQFRSGSHCVRVKVDDQILWKHKRDHNYPDVLEYDKRDGIILLEFPGFTDVYVYAEGTWYYRV